LGVLKLRFWILSAAVLLSTVSSSGVQASVVDDYLSAETNSNKEQSIQTWKDLLGSNIKSLSKQGLTKDIIRKNIVNDYVSLYLKEKNIGHLEKANDFIRLNMEGLDQGWTKLYILNAIKDDKSVADFAFELSNDIEIVASDNGKDGDLFYGLSLADISRAHDFIQYLKNDDHRIHVTRQYAKAKKSNHAPIYNDLYNAMARDAYPSPTDLTAIHKNAIEKDNFDVALNALLVIKKEKERTRALKDFFYELDKDNQISRMRRVADKTENPSRAVDFWTYLGRYYFTNGYIKQGESAFKNAQKIAKTVKRDSSRQKAFDLINGRYENAQKKLLKKSDDASKEDREKRNLALQAIENDDVVSATEIVKGIKDPIYRTLTFRMIAEIQMSKLDSYNILKKTDGDYHTLANADLINVDTNDIQKIEDNITNDMDDNTLGLTVKKGTPSNLGKIIAKDNLSEKLVYDSDMIRTLIPLENNAEVEISYYENSVLNSKFSGVFGNAGFVQQQQTSAPIAIKIENGVTDIPAIYDALKSKGYDDYMQRDGDVYTLNRPLVINDGATVTLQNITLNMSQESGAYIANAGELYISDAVMSGWNTSTNQLAYATYKDKRKFRPFLTAWSRSKTYIGASELNALGYGNGKSYGISYSAGPNRWFKHGNQNNLHRPTGIMADNSIYNAMYGYYSYEADDYVINGNEYIDNIVYGIDPHDRSRRLVIGYNTAYDTQKKHGIIISREVNDTLIAGNISFDNAGTGFMIDRESHGSLVYANTSFHNKNDGMTYFESDCGIIAANKVFENEGSGIRLRNSHNLGVFYNDITDNKQNGLKAYTGTLFGDPVHKLRDFDMDPYDELTTVSVVGNAIQSNGTGINLEPITAAYLKANKFINQSPKIARGEWFENDANILYRYDQDTDGIVMHRTCPTLPKTLNVVSCKYRDNGTLTADGQNDLTKRIKQSICAKSTTHNKKGTYH